MTKLRILLLAVIATLSTAFGALAQVPDYVGSDQCRDCHTDAFEAWETSHHGEAWRVPEISVPDDSFRGETFEHKGMTAKFTRADGAFLIDVTEVDGSSTRYTLHSIGGTHPLLHPILETAPGKLQSFDVVWDVDKGEWYHLYPEQDLLPGTAFHWTGPYKNWNARCAECHATGYEKNFDFQTRSYASTQSEIGVGCEACHGPGAAHIAYQTTGEMPAYLVPLTQSGFTAEHSDPQRAMEQCAGCHARREAFGSDNPLPGTPFDDAYNLSVLRQSLYHADGQILDEVYVYGSFLQSKMHQNGVTCSNCHEPHSADLIAEGNAVCTQCHSPAGNPEFPSLPLAEFDSPAHHKHPQDSPGSQCVDCHMTERVYMGIDWRRDHSFRVPRPDLSAETMSPDACTDCHEDETQEWAAGQIADWFPNGRQAQPHYGTTLAIGRNYPEYAAPFLSDFSKDSEQTDLVRATALWLLETGGGTFTIDEIRPLLSDEEPLIREAAYSALKSLPASQTSQFFADGLSDPVRSVRMAASRSLLSIPPNTLPALNRSQLRQAYGELTSVLANQLDFPEAHLQLAGFALLSQNFPSASRALQEALRLDPQHIQAWSSLIRVTALLQGREGAVNVLRLGLEANPDDPTLMDIARDF